MGAAMGINNRLIEINVNGSIQVDHYKTAPKRAISQICIVDQLSHQIENNVQC